MIGGEAIKFVQKIKGNVSMAEEAYVGELRE